MFKKSTPEEKLLEAAQNGKLEAVQQLLDKGANVNVRNGDGQSPLFLAAREGYADVVVLLVGRGASLESVTAMGNTPLMRAAISGHAGIVGFLLDKGADPAKKGNGGRTSLDWAKESGHEAVVKLLYDALEPVRKKEAEAARLAQEEAMRPKEKWVKMGEDQIAFIGTYPEVKRELTHIFNFASRKCFIAIENTETHTVTSPITNSFDELSESEVKRAFNFFKEKGGVADENFVLNGKNSLNKNSITRTL